MKIQHIAVIFIIIILPIALTMNTYINSQIDTINLQMEYNAKLTEATYSTVKAFQINTVNNRYSSISDSKIRDIEAAASTFYNVLASNENLTTTELKDFVPALVFTLYDGYYIYTKYDNTYPQNPSSRTDNTSLPVIDAETLKQDKYTNYGLKPYIYYSCRYKDGTRDFVVNYTLDNAITLYGNFGNVDLNDDGKIESYQTISGYLINPRAVKNINQTGHVRNWSLTYDADDVTNNEDVKITAEILTEHLRFIEGEEGDYDYLSYNDQRIYYDKDRRNKPANETNYFTYQNYKKVYITNTHVNKQLKEYLEARTYDNHLHSTSSFEYYLTAQKFSQKVEEATKGITQKHAIDQDGNQIKIEQGVNQEANKVGFSVDTGNKDIFVATTENDPLLSGSTFNENRMAVIRRSVATNLATAIANYRMYAPNNYEFALPELTDIDWEKITNKVSVISFLQGIPIGHKSYNNYCVITNDNNEETVNKENVYLITQNSNGEREYHLPGCTHLASTTDANLKLSTDQNRAAAYSNVSFLRQTIRISEGNYQYFYPQMRGNANNLKYITSCYHCIVNATSTYSADEIIKGVRKDTNVDWQKQENFDVKNGGTKNERIRKIRTYYLTALARERYDLYRANVDSFQMEQIVTPPAVQLATEIRLNTTSATMYVGGNTLSLTPTISPNNTTNKAVTWQSSNQDVATVDSNGIVTAVGPGSTTITVRTNDGTRLTTTCSINVIQPASRITLDKAQETITIGGTTTIKATIDPNNTTNKAITWTSSNTSVATVGNNGIVTGKASGTTTITATLISNPNIKASCQVTVQQSNLTLTISPTNHKIKVGEATKLTATVTPANAINSAVTWSSNNPSVAEVDRIAGIVTGKSGGTATITARTASGITATATIEVQQTINRLTVEPAEQTVFVGEKVNLKVTSPYTGNITWTSSDNSKAVVNRNGEVTTKAKAPRVVITAKDKNGIIGTSTITILQNVTKFSLSPASADMNIGTSITLTAYKNNERLTKGISWRTKDRTVATVTNGKITAVNVGTTEIIARINATGEEATCTVTVSQYASGVRISTNELELEKGQTHQLEANVLPETVANKKIAWSSAKPEIATVDSRGLVTAIKPGTTVITATATDGTGKKANCRVTVTGLTVADLKAGEYVNYIDPNGITRKCIVLYDNSSGYGVQAITEDTVEQIKIGEKSSESSRYWYQESRKIQATVNAYDNALQMLYNRANNYLNTTYATSARCVGSTPNVPLSEGKNSFSIGVSRYYTAPTMGDDRNYLADIRKLNAYKSNNSFWLASRESYLQTGTEAQAFFNLRYFDKNEGMQTQTLFYASKNGEPAYSKEAEHGLRPVFTLKQEIKLTGEGTSDNPYNLRT